VPDVVILHEVAAPDARPDNLDALVQVAEVHAALDTLGHSVRVLATDLDFASLLAELKSSPPDCVFNLVESLAGSDRLITLVPSLLATAGVCFTGGTAEAVSLSTNKIAAKRWMRAHDIATPDWFAEDVQAHEGASRWIVKSVWEHASLGIDADSVVNNGRDAVTRMQQRRLEFGGEWFAERFVAGREFNISMLEIDGAPRVLPIAEIRFDNFPADVPKIVGYAAKWDTGAAEYRDTPRFFPALTSDEQRQLESLASRCWQLFGMRGYARVDVRMDSQGMPWVLEVNANPCLSGDAGFAAAGAVAGLSYERLIESIFCASLRPMQSTATRAAAQSGSR
jgi:D-alanine-D-alanine ligase